METGLVNRSIREKVQYFLKRWNRQSNSLNYDQKREIGVSYLVNIVGIEYDASERLLEGDGEAYREFITRVNPVDLLKNDYESFWYSVHDIIPFEYSKQDLEWLIQFGVNGVIESMLIQFCPEPEKGCEIPESLSRLRRHVTDIRDWKKDRLFGESISEKELL